MIQAIVSDLGQVLLRFDSAPCWEKILAACDQPEARARFQEVYRENRIGCGQTAPELFYRRAAAAMGMRMPYDEFCVAWSDMFWEDPDVIELIAQGMSNEEVGIALGISPRTAKAHCDALRQKLGVPRRRQIPVAFRILTGEDPLASTLASARADNGG